MTVENDVMAYVQSLGKAARAAASTMSVADTNQKNRALHAMADAIDAAAPTLLEVNANDVKAASEKGIDAALLDRLELTPTRIQSMSDGLRNVAAQDDPVGALSETSK